MGLRSTAPRAAACALLLLLASGCHRADDDYVACSTQVEEAVRELKVREPDTDAIGRCMAAKGWRNLRPSLPPGSNAWARVTR